MGARGPAPRPNKLKVLAGESRPSRLRREVKATPGAPSCPRWLDSEARKVWRAVVPELRRMGTLAEVDLGVVAAYCVALSEYQAAVQKAPDVTDRSAMLGLAKIEARLLAAARELALTPASRARMGTKGKPEEDVDDLDLMMSQAAKRG